MRGSQAVSTEMRELMKTENVDILLMQEPYNVRGRLIGFGGCLTVTGGEPQSHVQAAIAVRNQNISVLKLAHLSNNYCTCVEVSGPFGSLYLASIYFKYSHDIDRYLHLLRKICSELRARSLIIAADANAKSPAWHSAFLDHRGEMLEQALISEGLVVLNKPGNPPTFRNHCGESTTPSPSASGPQLGGPPLLREMTPTQRFRTTNVDWLKFQQSLYRVKMDRLQEISLETKLDTERTAVLIQDCILSACRATMQPRCRYDRSVPWWTEELTSLKKRTYKSRKAFQTETDPAPES
ncbi:uncharacterized protein LOC143218182 [Lasioglossum baleicum]|uniref:uncharacterized protein LOC143218182 n=1 Tax=Lasioglossum baleicum TaxID=434251 RepID=UPI003FCEABD6